MLERLTLSKGRSLPNLQGCSVLRSHFSTAGVSARGTHAGPSQATPTSQQRKLHSQSRRPSALPPRLESVLLKHVSASGSRFASTHSKVRLDDIRNISAWGHIDAGKTTLTERLLYHTGGLTSSPEAIDAARNAAMPGDVDSGSTVTDFLDQERERGITIQSAAVGPLWWTSQSAASTPSAPQRGAITLIDTPGHIDFTIEVERALRVADGCIVVMDSVEGVEAQTEMNWNIGKRYGVQSNILFLNKLDRMGASVSKSIKSFVSRGLHSRPVLIQLPLVSPQSEGTELEGCIEGVVDLINRQEIRFEGRAGENMVKTPITDPAVVEEAKKARYALVESVASLDEDLMEELFNLEVPDEPHHHISPASLKAAIRRQTIAGKIVPALMGSAAKNIGIQPVLDAVVDFLPAPRDAGDIRDARGSGNGSVYASSDQSRLRKSTRQKSDAKPKVASPPSPTQAAADKKGTAAAADEGPASSASVEELASPEDVIPVNVQDKDLTALAFKVVWDRRRGPMTFVRVYSGILNRSGSLLNTTTNTKERITKILLPFGSTYTEVDQLTGGQVGVILGLRDTRTGDTLIDSRSKSIDKTLRLRRVEIPPPVFSVSVEPISKSEEESVNEALAMLVRTDPSLRLDNSADDSGGGSAFGAAGGNQIILSGMGELHLEIAKDRLTHEFGVKARIGGVRVSYRETIMEKADRNGWHVIDETVEREIAGKPNKVSAQISIKALEDSKMADSSAMGNFIEISLRGSEASSGNYDSRAEESRGEEGKRRREGNFANQSKAAQETPPDEATASGVDADGLHRSIMAGVMSGITRGPLTSNPLTNLHIRVSDVKTYGPELSPPGAVTMAISNLFRKVARLAGARMMEPVMRVRIGTEEAYLGKVVSDVTTTQAGEIVSVDHMQAADEGGIEDGADHSRNIDVYVPPEAGQSENGAAGNDAAFGLASPGPGPRQKTTVTALVPLARLTSYSTRLRALTAGGGTYTMQLEGFKTVSEERQNEILKELGRSVPTSLETSK